MAGPAETDLYDGNDETSERDRTANGMAPLNSLMGWIQREKGSANHVNKWRSEAKECFRFINGHQTSDADQKALNDARRPNNAFNSAQKFIRFVTGIERVAPTALLFSAIDESDVKQQIYGEFMTRCYDWALAQGDGNFERSRAFYDLIVGGMGWCLPGDTLVRMPEITAAYSRNYTGFVVDVDLENGKRLTGTANHPVLTQMGWKPLNALKEGDNLLSGAVLERIPGFSAKNFDQVETRLENVIDAFSRRSVMGHAATSADDFHGDGIGSKIHIVRTNRFLWNERVQFMLFQYLQQFLLAWDKWAVMLGCSFSVRSSFEHSTIGVPQLTTLQWCHVQQTMFMRLAALAQFITGLEQTLANGINGHTDLFSNLQRAKKIIEIKLAQSFSRDFMRLGYDPYAFISLWTHFVSRADQSFANRGGSDLSIQSSGDSICGKTAYEIKVGKFFGRNPDAPRVRVTGIVHRFVESLLVHNVTTNCGFYIAEGIVSSNCDYYVDRSRDPRGLPVCTRLDPMEMWWPDVDKQNLVNSRWRGRESMIGLEEATNRWPDDEDILTASARGMDVFASTWVPGTEDKPIQYTHREIETTGEETPRISTKEEVNILEWQWYDEELGYYFMDPVEQQDVWLDDKSFRSYRIDLLTKTRGEYRITDYARQVRRVHKKVFSLGGRYQLGEVINIEGNRFTLNCMTGTFDDEIRCFYGYSKILLDPQRYANKFFNQLIEIMAHQAKGGILYEKGALLPNQVADLNDNYTIPGTSQEVNTNAISGNQIKDKPLPQLPSATIAVLDFCIKSMDQITGLSPEAAFAGSVQDVPGVTLRQKTQSSMVLLNQEFDSLSRFRIEEGRILFNLLGILADDRLIKVGGAFDGSVIQFLQQPFALEYDLVLDDTERDPNIQNQYREAVMQLAPTLIKMNKFLPELLDYAKFLPVKIRMGLKKAIVASAQADQQAAAQGQSRGGRQPPETPQETQARIQKIGADTQLQMVKAQRVQGQQKRDEMKTLLDAIFKQGQLQIEKAKAGIEHNRQQSDEAHNRMQTMADLLKQSAMIESGERVAQGKNTTSVAVARSRNARANETRTG